MLKEALAEDVRVTLLADRGFGNTPLLNHLLDIPGFDFFIRFHQGFMLHADGYTGKTTGAVYKNGHIRVFKELRLIAGEKGPYTVVLYNAAKMKDAWCLSTNLQTVDGREIVSKYSCSNGLRGCVRGFPLSS